MDDVTADSRSTVADRADELLRGRLAAVETAAAAAERLHAAEAELNNARADYRDAYRDARKAGWTDRELTGHLNLPAAPTGTRRRTRTTKKQSELGESDE